MHSMEPAQQIVTVNYTYVFDFEEDYNYHLHKEWMKQNWQRSFFFVGVYMVLIFAGRHYMQSRSGFQLRGALILWNISLAVFSLFGLVRTVPELTYVLREYGFHFSVCNQGFLKHNKVSGFWAWLFIVSKVPELLDTVFIVLRKRPLLFLHWYHHITVLLLCWYSGANENAPARWFVVMNYFVHSCMYTYYALKAGNVHVPKFISMFVTSLQIMQMIFAVFINVWCYTVKTRGYYCDITDSLLDMCFIVYFSYFLLFARFFYRAYFLKTQLSKRIRQKAE